MKFLQNVINFLDSLAKWLKVVGAVEKGVIATSNELKTQLGQKVEKESKDEEIKQD